MPHDTLVPLLLALAMTVVAIGLALLSWWIVLIGGICLATCILAWLWPQPALGETVAPVTETAHG
jgi:hypothetical protein